MSDVKRIVKIADGIELTTNGTAVFTLWVNEGQEFQFEAAADQIDYIIEKLQSISDRLRQPRRE